MPSTRQSLFTAIRSWVTRVHPNPSSDADLVRQFAVGREESAFADLLDRHGPMVLGVARRITGDHHAAEDILQATFLILARKGRRGCATGFDFTSATLNVPCRPPIAPAGDVATGRGEG